VPDSFNSVTKGLIALGSNLPSEAGSSVETLAIALRLLDGESLCVTSVSRVYRTPAWPPGSGPDFANAAAVVETSLPPDALLARLHAVEAELGRIRTLRWGARAIDLDLLAYGDRIAPDAATLGHWIDLPAEAQTREAPATLLLPHPRLQDRGFVLVPLADVAPDWRHPLLGVTVQEMLDRLGPEAFEGIEILPVNLTELAGSSTDC
jgi:2-amino-4-hydroxy-6-hydroxymethyldihydropteridine diphosphokinase